MVTADYSRGVPDKEPMEVEKVIDLLDKTIPLLFRSAALYTWMAGTATGIEFQALGVKFEEFGRYELDDARHLIEKSDALGGDPTTKIAGFDHIKPTSAGLKKIIELETEALDALQEIIPATGQQARSEALEHRLEHIIMRKQEQVDLLERVRRG